MYHQQETNCGLGGPHENCDRGEHRKHYFMRERVYHHGFHHPHNGLRQFFTKEEKLNRLEEYLKELQAEAKGVEECIAKLQKES
jgi:hypothetical protein